MIRNIIWDLDGTLFNTYPAITRAFEMTLRQYGVSAPMRQILSLAKVKIHYCASKLAEQFSLEPNQVMHHYQRHYAALPIEGQPPFPGAMEVCELLCEIKGMNVIVTHRGRESTREFMEFFRVGGLFADIITRDDGFPEKPSPAAFLKMIERHGFTKAETLAVGDREIDIQAGKAAGIRTCLFENTHTQLKPDFSIFGFDELEEIIRKENGQ